MGRTLRVAWWLLWVLGAGLLALAAWHARSDEVKTDPDAPIGILQLHDGRDRHDLWSHARLWRDPDKAADIRTVLDLPREQFGPPGAVHGNLGRQEGAVWVRASFQVPAGSRSGWLLDVNYPPLDHVDLFLVETGSRHVVQSVSLGDAVPQSRKNLLTRGHVAELRLTPGGRYDLYTRFQSTSTLVLPMSVVEIHRYGADESALFALQGVLAGVGVALLIYSLAQGWGLREPEYAWYAVTLLGVGMFFITFFGLGSRFLWGDWVRFNEVLGPGTVLLALVGGVNFIDRVLEVRASFPRVSLTLKIIGWIAAAGIVLFAFDVLSYPSAQALASLLGPLPMVFGVPVAWMRYRQGQKAALYVFMGWGLYSIGVVVMALLMWGLMPANFWSLHAFQFSSMLEMGTWMMVLAVRSASLRSTVDQTRTERDQMWQLALTDPLTQVLNRRGLEQHLAGLLSRTSEAGRDTEMHAVFVMDLDGFKAVNDRFGHDVGDALLVEVARRLRAALRHADVVARTGGDEFVVVATGLTHSDQAGRIGHKLLRTLDVPIVLDGKVLSVGATVGYALAPDHGNSAERLLKTADKAMYEGKQRGKGQVRSTGQSTVAMASHFPHLTDDSRDGLGCGDKARQLEPMG